MSGRPSHRAHGRPLPDGPAPFTTLVELTFEKRRVEHWIRFGRKAYEQILDRRLIIIIATGLALAFGDTSGGFRKLIQIVFGLSIAFAASSFFLSFFSFGGGALI